MLAKVTPLYHVHTCMQEKNWTKLKRPWIMLESCDLMIFVLHVTSAEAALAHPLRLHLALTAV